MIVEDLLRCSTSRGEFALRSGDVRHVARAEQLRADDRGDGRIGVLRLGSQLVPVLSLDTALGYDATAKSLQGDQHIAVTGDGAELVGWLVDKLTREPAAGVKIAPMPAAIGGRACHWFEGLVCCEHGDVALLIDPRQLNPFDTNPGTRERNEPAFAPAALNQSAAAEPVALVFSTEVFPASPVDKFALSGRQVVAIVQPTEPIPVPGCAAHVAGVTLWRDAVVPIVDYRADANEQSSHRPARRGRGEGERRMIARCGPRSQSLIAFAINDEVVMHRPAADHRRLADIACPPFASGVFDLNGAPVALLNVDALAKFEAGREN